MNFRIKTILITTGADPITVRADTVLDSLYFYCSFCELYRTLPVNGVSMHAIWYSFSWSKIILSERKFLDTTKESFVTQYNCELSSNYLLQCRTVLKKLRFDYTVEENILQDTLVSKGSYCVTLEKFFIRQLQEIYAKYHEL